MSRTAVILWPGARAMVPWLIGVTPFGLVIGVSAAQTDLPTLAGWLTGPVIYTGSAQLATIQMLGAGAAPVAVVATALIINIRLFLYSAAMARHWRGTPLWFRLIAGYLLVDPSFVVGSDRYGQPGDRRRAHTHYLGAALLLWVAWLAAIAAGATAGARLPGWLHLEFLIPLYLVGELGPKLSQAKTRRGALTAAAVAVVALAAPMHLGIAVGIAAGLLRRPPAAGLLRRPPAAGLLRRPHAAGLLRRPPAAMVTKEASR